MRMTLIGISLLVGFSLQSAAQDRVTLSPTRTTITSLNQTAIVTVTLNDKAVPSANIGAVKFYVDRHDYDEKFRIEKHDGQITLTPTRHIDTGRYDLVVETDFGSGRAIVVVTLAEDPQTIENRAKARGITVDQLRQELGLAQRTGREAITIELTPRYTLGQRLNVSMETDLTRVFAWYINGRLIDSGFGSSTLRYTLKQTGTVTLRYDELIDGVVAIQATTKTEVVEEPAIPWEVASGVTVTFSGPEDFSDYVWRLDGKVLATVATLRHAFLEAGDHTLVCEASSPEPLDSYRKITYAVRVR